MKNIETAVELVRTLATYLLTLNRDTREFRPMPVIMPGEEGMQVFTEELRRSDLAYLAETVAIVHKGESEGEAAQFSSLAEAATFRHHLGVTKDFYAVVSGNTQLFGIQAKVRTGEYRVGVTIGEIILSFYEVVLEAEEMGFDSTEAAGYRAQTLSEQEGFIASPMMESMRANFLSTHRSPRTKVA